MDHLCYLCPVIGMLSPLFINALQSPAGKELNSCLSFVTFNCVFVTFPCSILGQVWYLIVSIPDLCHLSYFYDNVTSYENYWGFRSRLFKIFKGTGQGGVDS